jgi:hypothetical protein
LDEEGPGAISVGISNVVGAIERGVGVDDKPSTGAEESVKSPHKFELKLLKCICSYLLLPSYIISEDPGVVRDIPELRW